jgi:transposase
MGDVTSSHPRQVIMDITAVGLDIGKSWFHFVGCNRAGKPIARHKFNRGQLTQFIANLPACLIGMEACPGSQHLARLFQRHGHEVGLIAPKFIKAYVKSQKNDFNDAAAIAEAVTRPTMRFVTVKSNEQLDLQALHRIRERLVRQRTSTINQIRAFLIEYGLPVKEGRAALRRDLPAVLGDLENGLSDRMRKLVERLREHWKYLEAEISEHTREIDLIARRHDHCRRLTTIPGIGPLGATALVAAIGNGAAFKRGRELAAWLGLVPRQQSTGGRPTLLGIHKRGNPYVRRLLIHGARSLLTHLHRRDHELGPWMTQLEQRAHRNVVTVAVANKLARIAWAVLARGDVYRPASAAAAV